MFRNVFGCFLFLEYKWRHECRKACRESLGVRRDRRGLGGDKVSPTLNMRPKKQGDLNPEEDNCIDCSPRLDLGGWHASRGPGRKERLGYSIPARLLAFVNEHRLDQTWT